MSAFDPDQAAEVLAHIRGSVAEMQRQPATLRQIVERAVEADEAFNRLCREQIGEPTANEECDFMAAEEAQFASREALYQALSGLGISRAMANKIGRVLA